MNAPALSRPILYTNGPICRPRRRSQRPVGGAHRKARLLLADSCHMGIVRFRRYRRRRRRLQHRWRSRPRAHRRPSALRTLAPPLAAFALLLGAMGYLADWKLTGPKPVEATLLAVTDGDTVRLRVRGFEETRFRLASIDAPERGQPFGAAATRCLSRIISGGALTARVREFDRYGRLIGNLYVRGEPVDLQMVSKGCAWWYSRYAPANIPLAWAQYQAKNRHLGLWQFDDPVRPERWRRGAR